MRRITELNVRAAQLAECWMVEITDREFESHHVQFLQH